MTAPAHLQVEPTLSPEDVAALTGLHYQSVLAEIRAGALRAKKVRGRYLITRASYEAWLDPGQPELARTGVAAMVERPARSTRASSAGSVARLKALEGGGSS